MIRTVKNMNKNVLIIVLAVFFVAGGGAILTQINQDESTTEQSNTAQTNNSTTTPSSQTESSDMPLEEERSHSTHGSYVTLADYTANPEKYSENRKVHFFHASWCPNCQAIDKTLTQDDSNIPAGVTIIKTDFDKETDLRQKYGVTLQYTFVEVDKDGNELKQWSAPTINDVYEEL